MSFLNYTKRLVTVCVKTTSSDIVCSYNYKFLHSQSHNVTKTMAGRPNNVLIRYDNIVKSAEDKRSYRGLELGNRMKVLLVSDPTSDKSAAAMDVNVGFMCDPDNIPGLAHFCEHMLFLGTEKYPNENDYSKFLAEHGGSSNAATYSDHTTYYFDVVPEHLYNVLDRFAQFFISPLFTETATDRELNAVHSEHEKNIPSDMWRLDQLDKHTSAIDHAFHKFGTGNKFTLETRPKMQGISVRDELLKFHDQWYSSNIMALAILGKESLDELEQMVVKLFSTVKDKDVNAAQWLDHPFKEEHLRTYVYMVPIKDIRSLNIVFPTPDLTSYYKSSPGSYISHLVGHEGPGSLLSALKARGWSNNLIAGSRPAARGHGFFGISVDLTEEGINHVDDIIKLIFQYLNMLKTTGPLEWIQEEQKVISSMIFRFKDKESPRSYISNYVHHLHEYPLEEILCANYLLKEWRPDLIEKLLKDFTPDNARVAVIAKKFANETDQKEPWYGTDYKLTPIPPSTLAEWENCGTCDELRIPEKNDFVPDDFDLFKPDKDITEYPIIVQDTALSRVWFKQDDKFLLPKASLMFDFVSPLAYLDPMNCNLAHMFVQLFRDSLSEYAYAAELAGLKWDLTNTKYGLILAIGGYSSKQHILLEKIMDKLTNYKVDPKRFAIFKENYIRTLKNFAAEQPYQHAVYYLAVLLTEHSWTKQELLAATDQLTIDRLEAFIPQMLSKMHIECLIHGNANKENALKLVEMVENRLTSSVDMSPLLPRQLLLNRELQLEDGCNYLYEVQNAVHKSSCIELYYQCGLQNTENNMMLELFAQIIQEPCFNVLRTKEQLGYIVFSGIRRANGVQGLRVIIQSDKHPSFVDQRIEEFFVSMLKYVEEMGNEEFERHKEVVAAHRLEKPKQLPAQSALYWAEITAQQYHFDRANVEVGYLRTITKDTVIKFFKYKPNFALKTIEVHKIIEIPDGKSMKYTIDFLLLCHQDMLDEKAVLRRKLAVHVVSMADGGAGTSIKENLEPQNNCGAQIIQDVTAFKSGHGMYPLVQPYISITRKGKKCKL